MIESYHRIESSLSGKYISAYTATKNDYKNIMVCLGGRSIPNICYSDMKLDGIGLTDLITDAGITEVSFDYIGYGLSSKYDDDVEYGCTYEDAYRDTLDVIKWAMKLHKVEKVSLYAISATSIPALMVAERHPELLDRIIIHSIASHNPKAYVPDVIPKTFKINYENYRKRRVKDIPLDKREEISPERWLLELDKVIEKLDSEGLLDIPNGLEYDKASVIRGDKQLSDFFKWENITVPICITTGEWDKDCDIDLLREYYNQCSSEIKEFILIPEASHWVKYEKNRHKLVEIMRTFARKV